MADIFQVPSQVQNIRTLFDGGLKLDIVTQELNAPEKAAVFGLHKKVGWMVFKERPIKQENLVDLPDFKPAFKGDKTPGQRLRAVLYVYWEQNGSKGDYDTFYRERIEDIIYKYKEKLD